MLKRKITKIIGLTLLFLMIGTTSVLANSYNFEFRGSFLNSANYSASVPANGNFNPYVNPDAYTAATTYALILPSTSNITVVTDYKTNVTIAKTHFTYNSGFGGVNQPYRLMGYPSNYNFYDYDAGGSWQP